MATNAGKGDFFFDCIVERRRSALLGGRFGIIVGLLLLLIALAAAVPSRPADAPAADASLVARAG